MASDRIIVASKDFRDGQSAVRSLSFTQGLKLRPLLLEGANPALPVGISTRVSLFLLPDRLQSLLLLRSEPNDEPKTLSLAQLVGHICPSLDCDIRIIEPGKAPVTIHGRDWCRGDLEAWLRRITLTWVTEDQPATYLQKIVPLLRPIISDGQSCGFAAIAPWPVRKGIGTVGGLISGLHSKNPLAFSDEYVGVIERRPGGPRRFGGAPVARPHDIAQWASEQANLLREGAFEDTELYYASAMIAQFGGDPSAIVRFPKNRQLTTLEGIFDVLLEGEILAPVRAERGDNSYLSTVVLRKNPFEAQGLLTDEIEFSHPVLEALSVQWQSDRAYAFRALPNDKDTCPNSFLGCLARYCERKGRALLIDAPSDLVVGRYLGSSSARDRIETGMEVRNQAVRLSLSD